MSERRLRSGRPSSNGEEPSEFMVNLSVEQFKYGDVVWSRISGESWWPVQVVDEKCVAFKPKKIKNDLILVRLYGTFEHMYVEPVNCVLKIEKIFGQENGSNREIFQKFLEEDITYMKSGGQSAATVSELKEISEIEKEKDESGRGKDQIKGRLKRTMIADNSLLAGSSDNPKAAKQVKVVTCENIDDFKASRFGFTKRRTRSETFKARNEGTSGTETSNEMVNLNSRASTCSSVDKKDLRSSSRKNSREKLSLNLFDKASESKCVEQNAQIGVLDPKDIKKLVAKIVREVAEKTRNEALKAKEMENFPENTEYINSSRKKYSETKNTKRHIPRRAMNKDIKISRGDTQAKTAGPSAVGEPNGDSDDKIFECDNNDRTINTCFDTANAMEKAKNEHQGINGAHQSKDFLDVMNGNVKSESNFAKQSDEMKPDETEDAMNGAQRGTVIKHDASREKMDSPSNTKCILSPRRTRVMQSLGLIAPLGSPFCRNRLIRSLLP
ncbi:uncharacterized protein LOC110025069 [Phalaenopsis equestris]|uniref:uncharacterized protein LOC110025069 n=1 Tax=Phalaenopsis equestris TaxID=78828 RepID=UPI0009E53446|nr:uncharacterized protein LOC110025069 [Phalaenopsis equestris]